MANERDEFSPLVKRVLKERVGGRCSNPVCGRATLGPNGDPKKATCTGNAAHITAAAPGGPRYDPALTSEQRSSSHNGIWLCETCHALVDKDWRTYSADVFHVWKSNAEAVARTELEGARYSRPPSGKTWECPLCGTAVEDGRRVCLGCNAEVVYGLTREQAREAFKFGATPPAVIGCALFVGSPEWFLTQSGWGSSPLPLVAFLTAALALVCGNQCRRLLDRRYRKRPPRFVRVSVTAWLNYARCGV